MKKFRSIRHGMVSPLAVLECDLRNSFSRSCSNRLLQRSRPHGGEGRHRNLSIAAWAINFLDVIDLRTADFVRSLERLSSSQGVIHVLAQNHCSLVTGC